MKIYQLDYEELNDRLTVAMNATLDALVDSGLLTREVASEWSVRRVVIMVSPSGFMRRIAKLVGVEEGYEKPVVVRLESKED